MLSVSHLTTVFDLPMGPAAAVNDVSFEIAEGETLGLVGESGSGKSVAALSLVRLVQPPGRIAGGEVRLDGDNLLDLSERAMQRVRGARIGFIFQEPTSALNPVLTVGAQITEALRIHGLATRREAGRRAVELLDAVRIPSPATRLHDYPHQLSGGMRQRVIIASAIACRPRLLIADEPTTSLDVTIQAEILDLLREMKRSLGLSMLLITHDLGVVAETADRVAVMYAGRIVEQGPVQAVFRTPRHPYTRALLASVLGSTPRPRLVAIQGTAPALGQVPPGCAFHPRCPDRFAPCDSTTPAACDASNGHTACCHLLDRPSG